MDYVKMRRDQRQGTVAEAWDRVLNPGLGSGYKLRRSARDTLLRCVALLTVVLIAACDDDNDGDGAGLSNRLCEQIVATGCEIAKQNQCVHSILRTEYLWYREVPTQVDYDGFASPAETLDFLRYQDPGPDRFSYLTSEDSFRALFSQGQYLGFGFSSETDSNGRVWVRFVYSNSSAASVGMARGDEIVSVDGQILTDIASNSGWTQVFGPSEEGYQVEMVLAKAGGGTATVTLQKSTVDINTVLHSSVIDNGGVKTGYLVLKSFLSTTTPELDAVFSNFNSVGVTRVILDLRYNGGGSVPVAAYLASYLHNTTDSSSVFNRLVFNDLNQGANTSYRLEVLNNQLDLEQLIVITTGETASASEMMINGLSPHLDVKTVGSTTYGKPVGQNPFFFCGNALLPVTFEVENSVGVGDYFNGFPADCAAQDDVSFAFGAAADPMLIQALNLADTGSCLSLREAEKAGQPNFKRGGGLDAIIAAF